MLRMVKLQLCPDTVYLSSTADTELIKQCALTADGIADAAAVQIRYERASVFHHDKVIRRNTCSNAMM
jgi:hypothetical protein